MTGLDGNPALVVHEPRCKVCRSEHRHEIDAMLRSGGTQLEVRRHFNEVVGEEYYTPNNLSVHARKHLHSAAPEEWVRRAARADRVLGDPSAVPMPAAPEDALRTVVEVGLTLIDSGVCVPGPSDVIRAASELKRIEVQGIRATEQVMLREIKAFTTAVKTVVPEEMWDPIFAEYEAEIARSTPDARH